EVHEAVTPGCTGVLSPVEPSRFATHYRRSTGTSTPTASPPDPACGWSATGHRCGRRPTAATPGKSQWTASLRSRPWLDGNPRRRRVVGSAVDHRSPDASARFEALAAEVYEPLQRYVRRRVAAEAVDDVV